LQEFKEPVRVNGKDRIRECFVTGVATLERCLACEAEGVATPDKLHLRAQTALRTYDNASPLFTNGLASEAALQGRRPLICCSRSAPSPPRSGSNPSVNEHT
jgi:hypothetical protein